MSDLYEEVIHKSRYARWLDAEGRRETWDETVHRTINYLRSKSPQIDASVWDNIEQMVLRKEVMPSMRLMMTAGEACERDNICAYNCAYLALNHKKKFAEALYILMNGTGVGFSCERQEISRLPPIGPLREVDDVIVVGDSKLGWAKAFKKYLYSLWDGDVPRVDYSRIRPAGSRLVTFGGRASGPEPLHELFDYVQQVFRNAVGRKLNSLEVHDIMCKIGEIVVVGGVRRSALISLSNLSDMRMRNAKVGEWWVENKQRSLANNSVCYTEKPDVETFLEEWTSLVKSKSGERGIFNRRAAQAQASRWGRRDPTLDYGCNPCSEIILRDAEFCNLSEAIVRNGDSFEVLKNKVIAATIIGTVQSTLTKFDFLSDEWRKNCEEERLLGVSLTGIMDHAILSNPANPDAWSGLERLREIARKTNEEIATLLGISPAAAITCVKPSGTVSQLVSCASGLHTRHSEFYIRNIRMDVKDPMCQFLIDQGVPHEPDLNYPSQMVFSFPQASPPGAMTRHDLTAIEQLEVWQMYQEAWCEHKPSITVNVKDDEWPAVGAWVWDHFEEVSGVAFLPSSGHTYRQAPYEECSEEKYHLTKVLMPDTIDWSTLKEVEDNTKGSQELACSGTSCALTHL